MEEHFINVPRTARFHTLGSADTARSIWIVLHGYGQLARFFLNKFEGLVDDVLIAAPEGLSRFYLDTSHQRVGATWMTREDREHEIHDQLVYLDTLADLLRDRCPGAKHMHVLGFSQGVATACRWAIAGNREVDRVVLWGGSLPLDLDDTVMRERWSTKRIELVHGEQDIIVPLAVAERNASQLMRSRIPYTLHQHAAGHDLEPVLLQRSLRSDQPVS